MILPLASFERIAVLGLHRSSNFAAQRDRVHRRALGKAFQDSHLCGEHVSFVDRGDGALGFVFGALRGFGDEDPRGVNHIL